MVCWERVHLFWRVWRWKSCRPEGGSREAHDVKTEAERLYQLGFVDSKQVLFVGIFGFLQSHMR